jgi:outer membrane murein-binding lipoprotein Lpp
MKKSTVALLLAAFAAIAVAAPIAQGTGGADRVKVLETKVKALQARVARLESSTAAARSDVGAVKTDVAGVQQGLSQLQSGGATLQASVAKAQTDLASLTSCVRYKALPMNQYDGYLYATNGGALSMTTALDITETGDTPQAYAAILNPSCVGSANALRLSSMSHSVDALR